MPKPLIAPTRIRFCRQLTILSATRELRKQIRSDFTTPRIGPSPSTDSFYLQLQTLKHHLIE